MSNFYTFERGSRETWSSCQEYHTIDKKKKEQQQKINEYIDALFESSNGFTFSFPKP